MGQVPLDLPDPLEAKSLASAWGADDLLSQMAGEEIDRLLAQAALAGDEAADGAADEKPIEAQPSAGRTEPANPPVEAVRPQSSEGAQRPMAVSSFVAEGDPALEAELDSLLANLNGAPVALSDSGIVVPPGGKHASAAGAAEVASETPAETPTAAAPPIAGSAGEPKSAPANPVPDTDRALSGELDQVFDRMTASAGVPPVVDGATPVEQPGSIDLLKVLDPIVAEDAAKADESAAGEVTSDGTKDDEKMPAAGRPPIFVLILEWINAPMNWLSPAVRDAAGKVAIMTLINAAAVLLWVLFFRRR